MLYILDSSVLNCKREMGGEGKIQKPDRKGRAKIVKINGIYKLRETDGLIQRYVMVVVGIWV